MALRILYVGQRDYGNLEWSFLRAFERLGCDVSFFDTSGEALVAPLRRVSLAQRVARRAVHIVLPSVLDRLLPLVSRQRPYDLVFCHKNMLVGAQTLRRIADEHGALLFCYQPDHPFDAHHSRSNKRTRALIPLVDCYFTFGRFIMEPLAVAGAPRVEFLPFAHDPDLHSPPVLSPEQRRSLHCEVAFVGNHSAEREQWIRHLLDWDVGVWGHRWTQAIARDRRFERAIRGGPQVGAEFARIYAAADIGLNLIQVYADGHNMRSFEAPACGGFVMSNRTSELGELFVEDRDLVCFSTPEELREKVTRYLDDPDVRLRIAAAGRQRVAGETYDERAQRILDVYREMRGVGMQARTATV